MTYRLVLESVVMHFVPRFLMRAFELLARDPYRQGDYREKDAEDREMEVILIGKFLLTYWADHAVKELRIVRAESV